MPSVFTRIAQGELPCHKVAETADFLAFLDINPLAEGHTLVIPRKEVDYIFDAGDELYGGLWQFAKPVATAIGRAIPCRRVGVAVIGLEVPHAHIHLVPVNDVGDINFSRPKLRFSPEELAATAARIAEHVRL